MKNNDCLFSDIQNLCNAVSDWLIKKSTIQLKPTRQYPVPVVTSCVITAEPVKIKTYLLCSSQFLVVRRQMWPFGSRLGLNEITHWQTCYRISSKTTGRIF